MGKIVLLDDLTINQIAAGEVIERPASAVKEMVENSIDAGATNIVVEIRNGGTSYIRVTDNGKGVSKDDMEIAFERHATSKIREVNDLKTVTTMGFRGEALASIAAIATVEMVSKTADEDMGHKVLVEAGKVLEFEEAGTSNGTTITVQNLFFNTPVRYKFLKKDYTESGYIEDTITRLALANPNIAFRLINSGNAILQTPGNGNLKDTIFSIYGKEVISSIEEINYSYFNMKVSGFIGRPEISRSNRANQLFFINRRHVRDRILSSATEQAYKGILPQGKYPFLILNIEMDPEKIDINVHPAKLEVRFEEENKVFQLVYSAIKNGLEQYGIVSNEHKNNDNLSNVEEGKNSISSLFRKIEMEASSASVQNIIQNDIDEKFKRLIENLHADDKKEVTAETINAQSQETTTEVNEGIEDTSLINAPETSVVEQKVEETEILKIDDEEKSFVDIKNDDSISDEQTQDDDIIVDSEPNVDQEPLNDLESLLEKLKSYANIGETAEPDVKEEVKENEKSDEAILEESNVDFKEQQQEVQENVEREVNENETVDEKTEEAQTISNDVDIEETKKINYSEILSKIDDLENNSETNEGNADSIPNQIEEEPKVETSEEPEQDFKTMYEKIFGISIADVPEKEEKFEEIKADSLLSVFENKDTYVPTRDYKIIGLAFEDYIIAEIKDEMYIINAKSAYKRLTYEKLKTSFYSDDNKDSQLLLLPDIITLTHREMEIAKDNIEIFEKAGFILEEFGENTIKLSGAPSVCVKLDTKELFLDILEEINTVARTEKNEIEDKFLITVADNIVNKTKYEMDENEANNLMQNLLELDNPFDFGKIPVTVIMNKSDIEKKFARRK